MTHQHYCPISLKPLAAGQQYHPAALKQLSSRIDTLNPLPMSAASLRAEARKRATKMSIQGVQPKVCARFNSQKATFEIVDSGGKYILKPQTDLYPYLPENESLTMTLAQKAGLNVPFHGLIHAEDGSYVYFIKRFDRHGHNQKYATEDFAQLSGCSRDTKYRSSFEKIIAIIEQFCTFPLLEKQAFFRLCLFNFLTGNEDMHLKNFSLIQQDHKITLSPAYDLLNTTIALPNTKEEVALPLNGKKRHLTSSDWFHYLAKTRLQLQDPVLAQIKKVFISVLPTWQEDIAHAQLPEAEKAQYLDVVLSRYQRLKLND